MDFKNILYITFITFILTSDIIGQQRVVHRSSNIIWRLEVVDINKIGRMVILRSEFKSKEDTDVLCIEPIGMRIPETIQKYEYDSTLIEKVNPLDYYLGKFKHNQYVVENKNGQMETISWNIKRPKVDNTTIISQQLADLDPDIDIYYLTENRSVVIERKIKLSFVKLRRSKESIKLHYLGKGCEENNNESFIISSNWIDLPAIDK